MRRPLGSALRLASSPRAFKCLTMSCAALSRRILNISSSRLSTSDHCTNSYRSQALGSDHGFDTENGNRMDSRSAFTRGTAAKLAWLPATAWYSRNFAPPATELELRLCDWRGSARTNAIYGSS